MVLVVVLLFSLRHWGGRGCHACMRRDEELRDLRRGDELALHVVRDHPTRARVTARELPCSKLLLTKQLQALRHVGRRPRIRDGSCPRSRLFSSPASPARPRDGTTPASNCAGLCKILRFSVDYQGLSTGQGRAPNLPQRFQLGLPHGNTRCRPIMFSKSLNAMSTVLRHDTYGLETPGFPINEVRKQPSDPLATVQYSWVYWVSHLFVFGTNGNRGAFLHDCQAVYGFLAKKYPLKHRMTFFSSLSKCFYPLLVYFVTFGFKRIGSRRGL